MAMSYTLREGLAGFRRAKFAAVAATSAMAVALVLIGLIGLLGYLGQQVTDYLRQRVGEVDIFLSDQADERMARALTERADATLGVREATYVSREEAHAIFQREFGEDADIFQDTPFLPASIKVRVEPAYAQPDSLAKLVDEFESWSRVEDAFFNEPILIKVLENLRLLTTAGIGLGILVVLAALFLVANTIRLTIYARRLLIRTMKLVGATDKFIRGPFVVEGVAQGVVAGGLAALVLLAVGDLLGRLLGEITQSTLFSVVLVAAMLLLGALLGWLGSRLAVRRFIKKVALH